MTELQKVLAARAERIKKAEALRDKAKNEKRDLTEDESDQIGKLLDEADKIAEQIKDARAAEIQAARLDAAVAAAKEPLPPIVPPPAPGADPGAGAPAVHVRRHVRLRNYKGPNAYDQAYRHGMWLQAVLFNNRAAEAWCRNNGFDMERRAMSSTTNTAGGFAVPDEFADKLIDLAEEYGVFRRNAESWPMTSDLLSVPKVTGGITAYFTAENTAPTESNITGENIQLVAHELAALSLIPKSLAEDSPVALVDKVAGKIALAFATKEDQCGFIGDGTSTYGGIVGVVPKIDDGNHAGSIYTALAGNIAFSSLDQVDFDGCMGQLPEYPGINPAWYISKVGWAASMQRLVNAAGGNTRELLEGKAQLAFGGFPVHISQVMNSTTTDQVSTVVAFFGDLAMAAALGDRRASTISADGGGKYFEKRQIAILGTERFDAVIHDLGDATNAGAIVALKTPGA